MYCPKCFQNTIKIHSSGVLKLAFNKKSRDTSLFTYNLQKESHEQLLEKLEEKIIDFFKFYANFNNPDPIKTFEVYSSDFMCQAGCKIPLNTRVSVMGVIFSKEEVVQTLKKQAEIFHLTIDPKLEC